MSMNHPKEVLLIGYGAVGAIYSLILKNSGRARVTVVARSNYEAVKASGMNFQSRKYGNIQGWRPDRLFQKIDHALDRPYNYVPINLTPYSDVYPQPTYVLMQNGLNVEVDLYQTLKKLRADEEPRIISTAVWIGTGLLEKNVVEHNEFDRVSMGVYRPSTAPVENTPAEAELLNDFANILAAGGSDTTVVHEIQRIKFSKNLWNAVLGTSSALTRFSLRSFFRPPHLEPGKEGSTEPEPATTPPPTGVEDTPSVRATAAIPRAAPTVGAYTIPFLYDTLTEAYNLGTVLFPPSESGGAVPGLDPELVNKTLANTARLHASPNSTHLPSMLMDCEAGRPMEVEHVIGEVVRMGREAGVSMPRLEALYALLVVVQNQFLRQHREGRTQL